jgi:NAD(P)-dependent dehydrogenase (short-subunit alcohol dehydrogenase family)
MDLTDFARVEEVARSIDRPLDLLIGNAGIMADEDRRFGETDYATFRQMVEANLIGALHLAESFAALVERSAWKKMVFISARKGSMSLNVTGGAYGYRASKAGLNACVKSMSIDLMMRGIGAGPASRPRQRNRRAGASDRPSERHPYAGGHSPLQHLRDRQFPDVQRQCVALVAPGAGPTIQHRFHRDAARGDQAVSNRRRLPLS